jgi:hypothetical protein
MVKLIYSPIASLDGYVEDEQGRLDCAAPADDGVLSSTSLSARSARTSMSVVSPEIAIGAVTSGRHVATPFVVQL